MLPEGYALRPLSMVDASALAAAYRRNRRHLRPWEPAREDSFFFEEGQAAVIVGQLSTIRRGTLACWLLHHGDAVVGRVNLNNIVLGVLCSSSLGYWVDADHLGRGVARGAVEEVCLAAADLGLHRVEAVTQLQNHASQRVLEACGFEPVGTARRLLFIDGAWRDHLVYQRLLHDRPLPAPRS
ncbi:MAG: GNAT family protein [Nocardioidaceae bacterium]